MLIHRARRYANADAPLYRPRREHHSRIVKALRPWALARGWRKNDDTVYRLHKDWVVSAYVLMDYVEARSGIRAFVKPLALDDAWWRLVRPSEVEKLTLRRRTFGMFRANVPPTFEEWWSEDDLTVEEQISLFLDRAETAMDKADNLMGHDYSLFLEAYEDPHGRDDHGTALIAAHFLEGRPEQSFALAEDYLSGRRRATSTLTKAEVRYEEKARETLLELLGKSPSAKQEKSHV